MLERSQRPLSDRDRGIVERYRQNAIGTVPFVARFTFFGGAAGFVIGILWLGIFHWGDRGASFWPIVGLVAVGAAVGFPFDYERAKKQRLEREAAAAAKWALNIAWTGKNLAPLRPKRKFRHGEREPEQCEVLAGTLEDLDALLRECRPAKRKARVETPPTPAAKLADDMEPLGFYKYVAADQVGEVKAEITGGAYDWYLAAGRAFDADAERLAEGGVNPPRSPALATTGEEKCPPASASIVDRSEHWLHGGTHE